MNILVCIKQVPDDSVEVGFGKDGKPAIEGITPVINAFDTYALEMATRLKESLDDGSEITVLCVGPDSAKNSLKNCLAVGGDYAYLVSDEGVADTDNLGIAELIRRAIEKLRGERGDFDLVFAGKEATDIAQGQTGIYVAAKLNVGVATDAIDITREGDSVQVKHETDEGYRLVELSLPALVTVSKPSYDPRYPTIRNKMAARKKPIGELSGADLAQGADIAARLSTVKEYEPPKRAAGVKIQEETVEESTAKAIQMMVDARAL